MTKPNSNYSFSVMDYLAVEAAAVSHGAKMNGNKWLFLRVVKRALEDCDQATTRKNTKKVKLEEI